MRIAFRSRAHLALGNGAELPGVDGDSTTGDHLGGVGQVFGVGKQQE